MPRLMTTGVAASVLFTVSAPGWSQDQATVVAPLESRRPMAPAPKVGEGAPYYSTEQLLQERQQATRNAACIANASRRRSFASGGDFGSLRISNAAFKLQSEETRLASLARKAANATLAAEETRVRAAEGKAAPGEVETTEIARQVAVRAYDHLMNRDFGLGYDPVIDPQPPVAIDVQSATIVEENGREMLVVQGRIRNIRGARTMIPVITLAVYDLDGSIMMSTAAQPTLGALAKDEARPFSLRVPAWKDAARVRITPGQHAAFAGDRDFCRPRSGLSSVTAAQVYRQTQDTLRFNKPPARR